MFIPYYIHPFAVILQYISFTKQHFFIIPFGQFRSPTLAFHIVTDIYWPNLFISSLFTIKANSKVNKLGEGVIL